MTYHWTWKSDTDTDYETLFRPDGSEVTTITEPEDRVSYRDLEPVTAELNSLIARLRSLEAFYEATKRMADEVGHPEDETIERLLGPGSALSDFWAAYDALGVR